MQSLNLERNNISIGGVTGHTTACIGRVNGVVLYFDKQRIVVDLYVLREWNMAVEILLKARGLYHGRRPDHIFYMYM